MGEQEVRIPAAGRKGEPKNQAEMKDDTNAAREDKQVSPLPLSCYFWLFYPFFISLTIHQREKQWIRGYVFLGLGFKAHHLDFLV